jgi:Major Facilitator Superfamily
MGGIVMIFNVFLQNGLGFTPWHSALTTAPWAAGAFVGSAVGGIAMTKLGRRVLHAGLVVEAAGLLAIYAVLRGAGAGAGTVDLLAPMVAGGIGMGMVFVPLFDIVMAGVRPREMGSASGVLQTVNSLGMSLGIAGIGAHLLRPGRRPRPSRARLPGRRGMGRARHRRAAGLLVRGGVRAAAAGQGRGRAS